MANCKVQSFNARRAIIFEWKLTKIGWVILNRSDPHIHNEFQFSERYGNVSCSATLADGANSVRMKFNTYSHLIERWDTNIVPMTDEQEDRAWELACDMADLPWGWIDNRCMYNVNLHNAKQCIYKGKNAIPYDIKGQICHILPLGIWKPSKGKTWCTLTVNRILCEARPDWHKFLANHPKLEVDELKPTQLDFMLRYWLRKVA